MIACSWDTSFAAFHGRFPWDYFVGTLWTAGAVGWLGIPLSLLSAPFPVLILILGVDDVHFLCRYDASARTE